MTKRVQLTPDDFDKGKKKPEHAKRYIAVPEIELTEDFRMNAPYHRAMAGIAYRMRLLGLTIEQIAVAIGITTELYYSWLETKPDFRQAHDRGGLFADANVAHALYWRAIGYSYESEKIFYDPRSGEVTRVPYVEHVPPDVRAQNMWLTNRAKENWRNRIESDTKPQATAADAPPVLVLNIETANVSMNSERPVPLAIFGAD